MTDRIIRSTIKYSGIILFLLTVVVTVSLIISDGRDGTSFRFERMMKYEAELTDWKYEGQSITMPYRVKDKQFGDAITVSTELPQDAAAGYAIMYNTSYFISKVYVDGKLINEYGKANARGLDTRAENVRFIVDLPDDCAGKKLEIEYKPVYADRKIVLPRVFADDRYGLQLYIVANNFFDLLFCVIFIITSIAMVCVGIARYRKFKDRDRMLMMVNFASFVVMVGLWVFFNSDLPQFYFDKNTFISLIKHLLLACIGIPFLNVCMNILHSGKRVLSVIQLFNIIAAAVILILYLCGIAAPPQTLRVSHVIYVLLGGVSFYFAVREWKEYKDSRTLMHGMGLFILSVVAAMHLYYIFPTEKYSSIVSGFGLVIFIISLFMLILRQEMRYFEEHMTMSLYREMAYSDKLTGCGNRAALERLMEGFTDGEAVVFIMADVNRLKQVNDNYGHDAGDELILGAAKCLQGAVDDLELKEHAEVFRLGGDEFVVIIWEKAYAVGAYYESLTNRISAYNEEHEHKLSIAKGYAEEKWNPSTSSYADLYRIADMRMYADKELAHRMEAEG